MSTWLKDYMFAGDGESAAKASRIALWFADYDYFKSHVRGVDFDEVKRQGLKVSRLEESDEFQDAVLSVHHATMHTFSGTLTGKIIENHLGRAWVLTSGQLTVPVGPPPRPVQGGPQPVTRAERRRKR